MALPHKAIGKTNTTHNSKCLAEKILETQTSILSMRASPPHAPGGSLSWGSVEGFHFLILVELSEHSGNCYRDCLLPQTSWFVTLDYDIPSSLKTKTSWPLLCFSIFKGLACLTLVVAIAQSLCRAVGWPACVEQCSSFRSTVGPIYLDRGGG